MDRRSLYAVVLTFIILIGWHYLYVKPKNEEMAGKRLSIIAEKAREDSLAALRGTAEEAREQHEEIFRETPGPAETSGGTEETAEFASVVFSGMTAEKKIAVITDRMIIEMSSHGGELRTVKLVDFRVNDGNMVNLVPEGEKGGIALLIGTGKGWNSLTETPFDTYVDGAPLGEDAEIRLGDARHEVEISFRREYETGGYIEKNFTFHRDGYEVDLEIKITREGSLRNSEVYAVSWECGLATTEKDKKRDWQQFASFGWVGEDFNKKGLGKFGKETEIIQEGMVRWAGARTKYFLSAVIAREQRAGIIRMLGKKSDNFIGYSLGYEFRGDPRQVTDSFTCYFGPLDINKLKGYGVGLEKTIDLGWMRFFSVLVLRLMIYLKSFIPNYGFIIIILSVLTKVIFYRLTHKSFKSMKDMQRLQPKIKELQEKYKDNKEKINQEMMKLYKEGGVNPLGGCLPLIFQMPVFIALFNVLRNTIELRGAPFFLWINDLSSPDVLFSFGAKLPLVGNEFHLLPIFMGAAMVVQSKLGGSPGGEAAPAAQTKMMSTMMPVVFTVIFYNMPSGLVLYWLVNNILSIIQQYYIHKEGEAEVTGSVPEGTGGDAKKTSGGERTKNRRKN